MNPDVLKVASVAGGFLVVLSGISAVALLIKAALETVDEPNALILGLLYAGCGAVAMVLLQQIKFEFGIFLFVVAGISGICLFTKAIGNAAENLGGAVLTVMCLGSGFAGYMLVF
jgi:hypothetical protein